MARVSDVAKYFLCIMNPEEEDCITNLKLQKLLYFAKGHFLAERGQRLFNTTIEAWAHGPVVGSVYREYSKYGANPIPQPLGWDIEELSDPDRELLDLVYEKYKRYSAWQLRDMTHRHSIYRDAYGHTGQIENIDIELFFRENIDFVAFVEDDSLEQIALERLKTLELEDCVPLSQC
ncbi:SocA family protein [bacterium]|nr:SocA family protein [bacterium]